MMSSLSFHQLYLTLPKPVASATLSHFFPSPFPSTFPTSSTFPSKRAFRSTLVEGIRTLYLFTKSDYKSILLPITVFASVMAPITRPLRLPQVMFWIWLHLLQFCVSNQVNNPDEDAVNKPWRPIPAGRITVEQARKFRWYLVVSCLALSIYRGVLLASILVFLVTYAYNDGGLHGNIVMRNVCNALGYGSFELGATQLAGGLSVNNSTKAALMASSMMIFTTIHAADFRDEKGDRLEGKNTLPILYPRASRVSMFAFLVAWPCILEALWEINVLLVATLLVMGVSIGCRFMWRRDVVSDKKSYLWYNLWLSLAHLSLGIGNLRGWITS